MIGLPRCRAAQKGVEEGEGIGGGKRGGGGGGGWRNFSALPRAPLFLDTPLCKIFCLINTVISKHNILCVLYIN